MISVARKIKNKVNRKFFYNDLPTISQELDSILLDKNAIHIIKTLNKKGFEAYLVGGCIRDILLGMTPKDFDISTNATPKQIHRIFKRSRIIGRRFQIVHILFGRRDFIEVSTFRNIESNTKMLRRDNNFGTIITDAGRRDLTINALYYDIHNKEIIDVVDSMQDIKQRRINVIGDINLRFNQDPVRILRAIRFSVKLDFAIDDTTRQAIAKYKHLLKNIPAARLYEETLKLFHNTRASQTFQALIHFDCLQYLFPNTQHNELITKALNNTANRIKHNKRISPAFIFAVLLYDNYRDNFVALQSKIKQKSLASKEAATLTIATQTQYVSLPKFAIQKVINTWLLQYQLEQKNPKNIAKILQHKEFRMAFDFLVMRSQSMHPQLQTTATFWDKQQHKK
jgi:poly(A) polymerase